MAGIFGDDINSRADFFRQLDLAQKDLARLRKRLPFEDPLQSVARQLAAIEQWTAHDRTPTPDERESLDMALRMFREYEMTDDLEIAELRKKISGLHSYVESWPDDAVARDPNNDDDL
jgi:hypothetical protein